MSINWLYVTPSYHSDVDITKALSLQWLPMITAVSKITGSFIICSKASLTTSQTTNNSSSALLARWKSNPPVNGESHHKGPLIRKVFQVMASSCLRTLDLYSLLHHISNAIYISNKPVTSKSPVTLTCAIMWCCVKDYDIMRPYTPGNSLIEKSCARFMGPTWGPSGAGRTQVDPMLAPWFLLSGILSWLFNQPLTPLHRCRVVRLKYQMHLLKILPQPSKICYSMNLNIL